MQYSIIKIANNPVIIDAKEGHFLNTFIKTQQMPPVQPFREESTYHSVVCGAILHNEGCESINPRDWVGYMFAYPHADGYNMLTITDIHLTPTMASGGLTFTPFAALVESDIELNPASGQCISAFLRYDDMDIITNFINRECIYAMKEIKNGNDTLEVKNWKRGINDEHLLEVALSIK